MLQDRSILKLCKRATKRKTKGVHIYDSHGLKTRYFSSNRGVLRCSETITGWTIEFVPHIGF